MEGIFLIAYIISVKNPNKGFKKGKLSRPRQNITETLSSVFIYL